VSRPSITALMDGLVNRGLVERHPDPEDGRRVTHHLTLDGRSALKRADRAVGERLVVIGAHVHAGDSNRLIVSLARFGEAIRAARAAGAA
jgi:long-chain acyl-CoA synthetase